MNTTKTKNTNTHVVANLLLNIIIPSVILSRFSGPETLGPQLGLVVALLFPLIYGGIDLWKRKKVNIFSIIGFASVLLTGVFTLVHLNHFWFTLKETLFPLFFAVFSFYTRNKPQNLFFQILNEGVLLENPRLPDEFKTYKHPLYRSSSLFLTLSFGLSAVLNFVLAQLLLVSPVGSEMFNAELAYMNTLSYFVILIPSMAIMMYALIRFFRSIARETGIPFYELITTDTEPS